MECKLSQEDIENSGLTWPWNKDAMGIENNWQKLTPNVSLEAYVGKTVKIAFYFRSILVNNYTQATLAVDNVKVGNQEIENLPVVEGSTSYEFSNSYIGYLAQSEPMTIRNVGYGTLTITSIEGIEGTDFSTTLDPASVSLKRGEEAFIPRQLYSYDYGSQKHGHENKYEWRNFVGRFVGNQSYVRRRIYFGKFRR